MTSFNGFGTKLYGKRDFNPQDESYIATEWIIALFFPIIPLASHRVIKEKQNFLTGSLPRYQMSKVKLNIKQVIYTYLAWWSIPLLIILYGLTLK